MRGTIGHEVLAGAIGASSVLGGAFTSPLLTPVVDLVSAAATAGIAAHAAHSAPSRHDSTRAVLRRAARRSIRGGGAPLAAHVIEASCVARRFDTRALRAFAMLLGRAVEGHARPLATGLFGAWCPPIRHASRALDFAAALEQSVANVELMREVAVAAAEPLDVGPLDLVPFDSVSSLESTADDDAPPVSGHFPTARAAAPLEAA